MDNTADKRKEVPVTPPYVVGGTPCTRDPKYKWPEYNPDKKKE